MNYKVTYATNSSSASDRITYAENLTKNEVFAIIPMLQSKGYFHVAFLPQGEPLKPTLSNQQKEELAFTVMSRVADLVEYPEMWQSGILADCDPSAIRENLATWMRKLPGKMWDTRLD